MKNTRELTGFPLRERQVKAAWKLIRGHITTAAGPEPLSLSTEVNKVLCPLVAVTGQIKWYLPFSCWFLFTAPVLRARMYSSAFILQARMSTERHGKARKEQREERDIESKRERQREREKSGCTMQL